MRLAFEMGQTSREAADIAVDCNSSHGNMCCRMDDRHVIMCKGVEPGPRPLAGSSK